MQTNAVIFLFLYFIQATEHLLARLKIYFVCDFHLLQSKYSTSQCSGRRQKHRMKIPISSSKT